MDPLPFDELYWDSDSDSPFNMNGYLPPAKIDEHIDIIGGIRKHTKGVFGCNGLGPKDLRVKAIPIAATTSCSDPPQPGLLDSSGQLIPLHDRDAEPTEFLEYSVKDDDLKASNPRWDTFVSEKIAGPLTKMNANSISRQTFLSALTVQFGPMNCRLSVPKVDVAHYATAFIFLPTNSTSLKVKATFGQTVKRFKMTGDLSFSAQIFVCYAGIDQIKIQSTDSISYLTYNILAAVPHNPAVRPESTPSLSDISPVVPELRGVFRTWKWLLQNRQDLSAKDVPAHILYLLKSKYDCVNSKRDKALIGHLAPLAKAYGFDLRVVELRHVMRSYHEIYHPYKDDDEIDRKWDKLERKLRIEGGKDVTVEVEVESFRDLNERIVGISEEWRKIIQKKIEDNEYVSQGGPIEDRYHEVDLERIASYCYSDELRLTHTRLLLFLLVFPARK
ncbi:hypothetical protein K435DRAFT_842589 [Dendrothele bispora CBS 962.96]|uniref:Uncharacterized protein n=1 Tax=Dendrothele bispora (strain CBS 962.96) TaxID=1314807 RepID=A0A4V4HDI0_DENBC|nr:hypothetical protein K435DRAFT_842589 [Dendrothele bispora CBS 962.96]